MVACFCVAAGREISLIEDRKSYLFTHGRLYLYRSDRCAYLPPASSPYEFFTENDYFGTILATI
jgi:hypothetical protein